MGTTNSSTNVNVNYYASNNDSFTNIASNVQIAVMLSLQTTSLLGILNLLLFVPLKCLLFRQRNPSTHISSMMRLFLGCHAILLLANMAVYLQKVVSHTND
jgi:hypothetical protein